MKFDILPHIKSCFSIGKKWVPSIFSKIKFLLEERNSLNSGARVDPSEAKGT
jgi:hypothetical protein